MTLNTIGYLFYLLITCIIIIYLGKVCYKNGNIYVLEIIPDDKELCIQINKMLLIGFYLVNIGYCSTTLINWTTIKQSIELVEMITSKIAIIIAILGILHYSNIYIINPLCI